MSKISKGSPRLSGTGTQNIQGQSEGGVSVQSGEEVA